MFLQTFLLVFVILIYFLVCCIQEDFAVEEETVAPLKNVDIAVAK